METPRLLLRPLRVEDAPNLSALMTYEVSKWLTNFPLPFSPEDAAHRINQVLDGEKRGRARVFAFERKAEPGLIGWFGTYTSRQDRLGILGYWLGEPFQALGLMTEGAPVALSVASTDLRLESVEAYIHPENAGSRALVRRLGLAQDGETLVHSSARDRDETCLRYVMRLTA
ncbi:MAG: GNAT family N-acetyltransferase [Caulobacteraceae bacterium]